MKHLNKLVFGSLLCASVSFGQVLVAPADAVQQEALGNLTQAAGDSDILLFNAGYNNGDDLLGTIVAQVYVFDAKDEQLIACCSCPLTPDAAATISGKTSLIANPLTPAIPDSVTVKLIATKGGFAYTDQTLPGAPGFSQGLRADRTTTHVTANYPAIAPFVTESPFKLVTIAKTEYAKIILFCQNIHANGSGFGICGGCRGGASNYAPTH
jgi:hypothetical protein